MSRVIRHVYRDPLDEVWLHTAVRVGFAVQRSGEVYAHSDGRGVLHLADSSAFDPDDSLAQLILHELCHALIEGERSWTQPDWGLDNVSDRDERREHAALRLQAALLEPHGLRWVLAPTTDFRAYFDALGSDPLSGEDEAAAAAQVGLERSTQPPFEPALREALDATGQIVRLAAPFAPEDSVLRRVQAPRSTKT